MRLIISFGIFDPIQLEPGLEIWKSKPTPGSSELDTKIFYPPPITLFAFIDIKRVTTQTSET